MDDLDFAASFRRDYEMLPIEQAISLARSVHKVVLVTRNYIDEQNLWGYLSMVALDTPRDRFRVVTVIGDGHPYLRGIERDHIFWVERRSR